MASLSVRARGITDMLVHIMDDRTMDGRFPDDRFLDERFLIAALKIVAGPSVTVSMDVVRAKASVAAVFTGDGGNGAPPRAWTGRRPVSTQSKRGGTSRPVNDSPPN